MHPPGRWSKVHIGGFEKGVPWPGMMFRCVYCSERPGGVHRTEFIRTSVLTRTHHGVLQFFLHSFRVDSPSCTSTHEVLNHSNRDYSTAQRRRGLQKHRESIFCIVIPQSIVHGVLPRAHINDCWWHDPAHQGGMSSFVVW